MNIGDKFGKLTVVSERFQKVSNSGIYFVECACDCGSSPKSYRCTALRQSRSPTRSCGCLKYELQDVLGQVYERLTIIGDVGVINRNRYVICNCACGTTGFKTLLRSLRASETKSCGCLAAETSEARKSHNQTGSPTYLSWQSMKTRCTNENSDSYSEYGGRGITYDSSWESFESFLKDMGQRPEGMTLDRINVDGNYCKENCRWIDKTTQAFNRRKWEGTSSIYIGVSKWTDREGWRASLSKDGVRVFYETFDTEVEAAIAFDEACLKYYGVKKNFP